MRLPVIFSDPRELVGAPVEGSLSCPAQDDLRASGDGGVIKGDRRRSGHDGRGEESDSGCCFQEHGLYSVDCVEEWRRSSSATCPSSRSSLSDSPLPAYTVEATLAIRLHSPSLLHWAPEVLSSALSSTLLLVHGHAGSMRPLLAFLRSFALYTRAARRTLSASLALAHQEPEEL